jgi:POT family proton-dependent oligopeptide transporter
MNIDKSVAVSGHPRGLYTLFFTEMWERLSYYGMRALLVLFMVDQVTKGGLGFTDEKATAIYGLYTAAVYLACLPGGWIADRLLGAQRAVWCGGVLIALGHFVLGVPMLPTFFLGLMLVVLGTGLLKPNVSTLVGYLYPEGGARRDAGFSIFYMGINLGAFIGPLVCSYLGEKYNWHWGFTAAGVGMVLGLIQFHFMRPMLGEAGRQPPNPSGAALRDWSVIAVFLISVALVFSLAMRGIVSIDPVWIAGRTTWLIVGVAVAYFTWALLFAGLDAVERGRVVVIGMLFVACAMFWAGFEQAGSSLNLFAERYTIREVESLDFEIPAGWFQSINAIFIILFAPVAAALWVGLARRNIAPSLTAKMAGGLLLLALGFVVIFLGAKRVLAVGPVWPTWLIATYLIHTFGELCLSPVGLSAVTKLAPPKLVGQMMGVWFLATSLGNLIAGLLAGNIAYLKGPLKLVGLWNVIAGLGAEDVSGEDLAAMPIRFFFIVLTAGLTGVVLLVFAKPLKRMAGGVQ